MSVGVAWFPDFGHIVAGIFYGKASIFSWSIGRVDPIWTYFSFGRLSLAI